MIYQTDALYVSQQLASMVGGNGKFRFSSYTDHGVNITPLTGHVAPITIPVAYVSDASHLSSGQPIHVLMAGDRFINGLSSSDKPKTDARASDAVRGGYDIGRVFASMVKFIVDQPMYVAEVDQNGNIVSKSLVERNVIEFAHKIMTAIPYGASLMVAEHYLGERILGLRAGEDSVKAILKFNHGNIAVPDGLWVVRRDQYLMFDHQSSATLVRLMNGIPSSLFEIN